VRLQARHQEPHKERHLERLLKENESQADSRGRTQTNETRDRRQDQARYQLNMASRRNAQTRSESADQGPFGRFSDGVLLLLG
jgi:hypothetical protein